MNQAASHITDAQIRDFLIDSTTDPVAQKWLEAHLADCESCLDRLLQAERIHLGLLGDDGMKRTPYPGCPAEETLQELAAGICAPDTAATATEHAAQCDHCGPLLCQYLREFSDEAPAEDTAIVGQLQSSTTKWQKQFVRNNFPGERKSFFGGFWPRLATAGAAAAIAVGAYFLMRPANDLQQEQQLVASAYGERRTTEMRFPGAPAATYNPVPIVKGAGDSGDWKSAPAPLMEAEAILAKKSKSGELDPQWLQVEGRVDLLQGSPRSIDQAIDAFEKALAKNPQRMELKVDLAAAYFEKEMLADHEHPVLMKSIDLLTDVVKNSRPEDAPVRTSALFDLAIAYEKSQMLDLAISAWEQYLVADSSSDWAKEAQKHLTDLKSRVPPKPQLGYETPAYFLAHSRDPAVLNSLEEYQDLALRSWLPEAVENPQSESARAVGKLAELLRQHHSDTWLQEFLAKTTRADLPAVKNLAGAANYDLNDLHRQAIVQSHNAVLMFARDHNLPGELRAQYQEIYGLQRSLAAGDCLERAEQLWKSLSRTGYRWLQAQLALEKATCANRTLDFDTTASNVAISFRIAQQFRFPELNLRIIGLDAGMQQWQENYQEAWKRAVQGLTLYWAARCLTIDGPPAAEASLPVCPRSWERLYQFYSVMQQCARKSGLAHASEALLVQSMSILENSAPDDVELRAILHLRLANTLLRQGSEELAQSEAGKAESLLSRVSQHEGTAQIYTAVTRIELADFELKRGKGAVALAKIEPLQTLLPAMDDFVKFDFYTVRGEILRQLNRLDEAIAAYRAGILVAEERLRGSPEDSVRLNWALATGRAYRGLTRSLLALGKDANALSVWEEFESQALDPRAAGWQGNRGIRSETTSAYRPIPSTENPHLVYASFDDGLQVWLVTGSEVRSKWVAMKRQDLQKIIHEFVKECADPQKNTDKARELYTLIVQPLATELPASGTLVVELDEPLWGLAFGALEDPNHKVLAERYSFVYSPGLLAEAFLRRPSQLDLHAPVLLIDASESGGGSLPGHLEEIAAVKTTFAGTRVLGPSHIARDEIERALSNSEGFHFSGHGSPEGTGTSLLISPQATLKAQDFSPARLRHLQLAVLSACSSGSAKKGAFDESNLVRSFLAGGVPSVVASGWDVDSLSTAQFMRSFYSQLKNGAPAAQALHYAQAEMRSEKSHPYYWAAFTLNGRVN